MKCRTCGIAGRLGQRYCESCGGRVEKPCPACGAPAPALARFCGSCGTPFPGADSEKVAAITADGERRQLTVLFADVVGATALSGRLDPEALRDVLRAYHLICNDCVTRYDGTVNQYLGDGVLAYFGYPAAHENDAERAVRAGLAIVAEVQALAGTLAAKGETGIEVRVGIHTGLVVVGEVGIGQLQFSQAIGETPNLAARTQGEAAPNSVCISAATFALIGEHFHTQAMGPRALKGVATPTELFRVLAAVESDPLQRRKWRRAPIIGRTRELQFLVDRWELARLGRGQAVMLSGEGGIGKSRLMAALRERIATTGETWRSLHCSPFYQNSALHPVIDLIERALHATGTSEPPDRPAELRRVLQAAGIGDDTTLALVGPLLGLPDSQSPVLADLGPERCKRLTLEALISWLKADARERPLVVTVEDLHWADASSRELFGLLLERIVDVPVLLVFTFRPEFIPPWAAAPHVSALALHRLSADQVATVARGATSGKALPARIVDEIVRRTDGVPLFVEEMTKAIIASGLVVEQDGAFELAGEPSGHLTVPATLRDSLTARLDRLGAAKAIAQIASVLGREFDYPVLQSACDVPEPELEAHLAALNRAEIIQQAGLPPRAHFVFKHALIQEAAYDTLLKSARQQCHRRVAQAYVTKFPGVAQLHPELVAHHFSRAAQPEEAVRYWQRAGELAVGRCGYEEAIAHLGAALEQIATIPESRARSAMELALRVKIGPALMARQGMGAPETGANYARACELAEALGDTADGFTAMWGDWLYKNTKGRLIEAASRSEGLVALARRLGDDQFALQSHHSRWTNFFFLGNVTVARADTLRGIELYDRKRHGHHKHLYGGHDPGVCAHNFGAVAAWLTGHSRESVRLVEDAMSLADELDHALTKTSVNLFAPLVMHGSGQYARAVDFAERLIGACEKHGVAQWLGCGLVFSGASRALQGDTASGLKLIEDGLALHRKTAFVSFSPMLLALAAEAHLRGGDSVHALNLLSEAIEVSRTSQVQWYVPEVQRLHAETMLHSGRIGTEEAVSRLGDAIALARQQGATVLECRAAAALACALEKAGRKDEARQVLRATCESAGEDGDALELDAVTSLLSALG